MKNEINFNEKENLKKIFAKYRLDYLSGYRDVPVVTIDFIPKKLTKFPGMKDSYWKNIPREEKENKNSCFFKLGPKEIFFTHIHISSDKNIKILTKDAKVEWVTEEDIYFYGYNDNFSAPKGMKHALVNLKNEYVDLEVDWSPAMIGWNALFADVKSKSDFKNKQ